MRLVNADVIDPAEVFGGQNDFAQDCRNAVADLLDRQPTIDPESLPIVQELREQLAKVTAERDAVAKQTGIEILIKLSSAFPNGFVNRQGEFIAHKQGNSYFRLSDCETELDVKCKVLEWLSRDAYKTSPFHRKAQNQQFNSFILAGICKFMEHDFTAEDMEKIYTYLGNRVNHAKTIRFIESGYDMQVLEG